MTPAAGGSSRKRSSAPAAAAAARKEIQGALRQGKAIATRSPTVNISSALEQIKRLRAAATGQPLPSTVKAPDEYRIDDLARVAGTTTRNIRAYQDRGLLPPPRRQGRVGIYSSAHLARLRLIASLLDRGYTSAQITELVTAWEHGRELGDVLGLEEALVRPWSDEQPTYMSSKQTRTILGSTAAMKQARDLGLIQAEKDRYLVRRPQLISAFNELAGYGFPIEKLLDLHSRIGPRLDLVANDMVSAALDYILSEHGEAWLPDDDDIGELTTMFQSMRQLAMTSVMDTLAHAMENTIEKVLGAYMEVLAGEAEAATGTRRA